MERTENTVIPAGENQQPPELEKESSSTKKTSLFVKTKGLLSMNFLKNSKLSFSNPLDAIRLLVGRVNVKEVDSNTGKCSTVFKGSLSELGITNEQYQAADKDGKAADLVESAQNLLKHKDIKALTGESGFFGNRRARNTMKNIIRIANENFTIILGKDAIEDEYVQETSNYHLVRIKDHKFEVWKKGASCQKGGVNLLHKIENVASGKFKFMKMSTNITQEGVKDIQNEEKNTRDFSSVGVGVEGSVFLKDQPGTSIGFITDLAPQDYSSKIQTSSLDGVVEDATALCSLLNEMHKKGTHNDIKPANIVVLEDGSFKFIDFDGARSFSSQETAEVLSSTKAFTRQEEYANLSALDKQLNPERCLESIKKSIQPHPMIRALVPLVNSEKGEELTDLEAKREKALSEEKKLKQTGSKQNRLQLDNKIQEIKDHTTNELILTLSNNGKLSKLKEHIGKIQESSAIITNTKKELLKSLDNYEVALSAQNSSEEKKDLQKQRDTLSKAIDIHQMGVTLYLRCCGTFTTSGNFDVTNFPYEIGSNSRDQWPKGKLKDLLFEGKDVPLKLQNLIRAMLTENPTERITNYEAALTEFQSDS
jgi:serine/threonine protein kinase